MDSAFKTAAFPGYTTEELKRFQSEGSANIVMINEIERREAVAAGDVSKMTPGERLRFAKTGAAR